MATTFQAAHRIPDFVALGIGKVIAAHAHLEELAHSVTVWLLDLDAARGRVAVRTPRITDRLDMIAELATIRHLRFDDKQLSELRSEVEEITTFRDALAHGVWGLHPTKQQWMVQTFKGTAPNRPPNVSRHAYRRRLRPAVILVGPETFLLEVLDIEDAMAEIMDLKASFEAQLKPSPDKHPRPPAGKTRKGARAPTGRRAPRKSSPK